MPRYLAPLIAIWQSQGGKPTLNWNEMGSQEPHGDAGLAESHVQPLRMASELGWRLRGVTPTPERTTKGIER